MGSERIHPRQNKGDRSLLNTPQGSSGQESKGETVCARWWWGGCSERGKVRRCGNVCSCPFLAPVSRCK